MSDRYFDEGRCNLQYDRYGIDKLKENQISSNDPFLRLYSVVEADIKNAPQHALKVPSMGMQPMREPPFGMGPMPPHPAMLEEMRAGGPFGRGLGLPLHPAILEEKLAAQ